MEVLILIAIVALLVAGYYQAKKGAVTAITDNFVRTESAPLYGIDIGHRKDQSATRVYFRGNVMTPKEYGQRFANGRSRPKKSNRLKLRR